jgi:tetratricopeptide (TPR) repeat protein
LIHLINIGCFFVLQYFASNIYQIMNVQCTYKTEQTIKFLLMKTKIVFIALSMIISIVAGAQNSAITNAILFQRDGNLLKAKQNIDLASENEKTILQPKTWYYKGIIYSDIYNSDKVEVKELATDPLKTSTECLLKSKELEKNPAGEYTKLANTQLQDNWVRVVNRGNAYYQSNNYKDALDMFELAQKINPEDTTAYLYGAYAAEGLKQNDLVLKFSNKLLSLNYKSLYVYSNIINSYMEKKEYAKAISECNKALQDFPMHKAVLEMRTYAYSEGDRKDEGIEVLKTELKSNPYNLDLLTSLAVLYSAKKNDEKAMEVYNKIIAIEPHNYFANYNSAVLNFDKGNELIKKGDKSTASMYLKKSLENAKRAKALTIEEADLNNLNKLIAELNTLLGNK